MMKNVNNIKLKRFVTYLNIYIGFSPLSCCFPIHSVRAKKQLSARLYAHKGYAPPKLTLKTILILSINASLFSYYKTSRLRLFILVTVLHLYFAIMNLLALLFLECRKMPN